MKSSRVALLLILAIACGVRLVGLVQQLPYLYHADELINYMISSNLITLGHPNRPSINYPPSFYYTHGLIYLLAFKFARLMGFDGTLADFTRVGILNIGTGYVPESIPVLAARLFTALVGALTVLLLYAAALALLGDRSFALLCALFLAIYPPHVAISHYMIPDIPLMAGVVCALLGSALILKDGRARGYIVAGTGVALAFSFKLTGIVALAMPLAAHILRFGVKDAVRNPKLYSVPLLAAVLFIAANPMLITNPGYYWKGLVIQTKHYSTGHHGMEGAPAKWYLAQIFKTIGLLVIPALAALAFARRRWRELLLIASFALPYYVNISLVKVRNIRTLLPLIPLLLLTTALGARELWHLNIRKQRALRIAVAALIALGTAVFAYRDIGVLQGFLAPDGRATAQRWIYEHIPPGAKIAIEPYAPYIDPFRYRLHPLEAMIVRSKEWFEQNTDYMVFCSKTYERYFKQPERYAAEVESYNALFKSFDLIYVSSEPPPEIRVYRVRRDDVQGR